MAIIQSIRNRAGILVSIIIGMALVAFILGDFLTSGGTYFRKNRTQVAVINGEGISYETYQRKIEELEEITKMQMGTNALDERASEEIRQRTWQEFTQEKIMNREYNKLGLTVHSDELYDLIGGENPHPYIQQFFADPNTGVINRENLHQFLSQMNQVESDNENKKVWLYIEDLIYSDRKITKYRNLLRKGLYATSLETNRKFDDFNKSVDFSYIVKPYTGVADTTVSFSEKDIKEYYKKHKEQYKQKASRDIRYVVWEVIPSENDYNETKTWITEVAEELKQIDAENAMQYIRANSDVVPDARNFAKGELPYQIDSFAFAANTGDIYGPYFEDNSYKLARLVKVVYLPDSVRASHILLQPNQNNYAQVQALADSLLNLVKSGADFETLARTHSADGSREKGGDLGWFKEGQMVKPFNDTCFEGKTGDIKLVNSQFGIHIVKIVNQSKPSKKVQVGILSREVKPSEETDHLYYTKASSFGGTNTTAEKFNAATEADKSLKLLTASSLTQQDQNIPGVERSRELVRWAFNAEVGDVTNKVYQFDNKYVVAVLDKIREEGYTPLEEVKNIVQIELRKQKQAEKLISELEQYKSQGSSLNDIAAKIGAEVKTATNIRFSSYSIPGLGVEPKLVAAATNIEQSVVSDAIDGNNGVYLIQVDKVNLPDESMKNNFNNSFVERTYMSKVFSGSTIVLNDLAKIKDNRINFY
ncbi:MAG: SurA N-terminal domain-containing protein [Bacteroidales bacterium]|nr:SurA N-terminal domain-containing protein [Bacteroidales bacterium]